VTTLALVCVLVGVAVVVDARRLRQAYSHDIPGGALGPGGWGVLVAVMPLIFLPAYVVVRRRFTRRMTALGDGAPPRSEAAARAWVVQLLAATLVTLVLVHVGLPEASYWLQLVAGCAGVVIVQRAIEILWARAVRVGPVQ
jgi:hypothetical protein